MYTFRDLSDESKSFFRERLSQNTWFTEQDLTRSAALYNTVYQFASSYTGKMPFMQEMALLAVQGVWLTPAQARGVLNCMLRGLRDNMAAQLQHSAPQSTSEPVPSHAALAQARAIEHAKEERVRLFRVEGRPGVFRTRSKSDPKKHYTVIVTADERACSCQGFEHRQDCKHLQAGLSKVAREVTRTRA